MTAGLAGAGRAVEAAVEPCACAPRSLHPRARLGSSDRSAPWLRRRHRRREVTRPELAVYSGDVPPASGGATGNHGAAPDAGAAVLAPEATAMLHREVLRGYLDVHGKAPHEVLGVARDASVGLRRSAAPGKRARFLNQTLSGVDLGPDVAKLESVRAPRARLPHRAGQALPAPVEDRRARRSPGARG